MFWKNDNSCNYACILILLLTVAVLEYLIFWFIILSLFWLIADFRFWIVKMASKTVDSSFCNSNWRNFWVCSFLIFHLYLESCITNGHNGLFFTWLWYDVIYFSNRYLAPEYFLHGIVDEKTDVFSFGVLLLEIISGRRPIDASEQNILSWVSTIVCL